MNSSSGESFVRLPQDLILEALLMEPILTFRTLDRPSIRIFRLIARTESSASLGRF
jgi:hypothetical protein